MNRRQFLWQSGGIGGLALTNLLGTDGLLAAGKPDPPLNGGLHHKAKVRRVIQLFMNGGVSQVDTFDYKPELARRHGRKAAEFGTDFDSKNVATSTPGTIMKSPFEWQQHGLCGRWVS